MLLKYDNANDFITSFGLWITVGRHGIKTPETQIDMFRAYKELLGWGVIEIGGNNQEEELEKVNNYMDKNIRELQGQS